MGADPDPLVEELLCARRDRQVLAVTVGVGIIASVILGLGSSLGALGGEQTHNQGALAYFTLPLAASLGIGYGLFWLRGRRRRRL